MKKAQPLCDKRCRGRILNKEKGVYCPHIEAKLPRISKNSIKAIYSDKIDSYGELKLEDTRGLSEPELRLKLSKAGLSDFEVELLFLRFIEKKSIKVILKEQGWLNVNSCNHFLRGALKKLRLGGFKF